MGRQGERERARTVIVVADLLLVLVLRVEDDIGYELEQHMTEELERKSHFREIVAVLHRLEDVAYRNA